MKLFQTVKWGALILVLSGCVNLSSPTTAVQSAVHALRQSDLKSFKETLTVEAGKTYGEDDAFKALKVTLAQLDDAVLNDPILIQQWQKERFPVRRDYLVEFLLKKDGSWTKPLQMTTRCEIEARPRPGNEGTHGSVPEEWIEHVTCRISKIEKF